MEEQEDEEEDDDDEEEKVKSTMPITECAEGIMFPIKIVT